MHSYLSAFKELNSTQAKKLPQHKCSGSGTEQNVVITRSAENFERSNYALIAAWMDARCHMAMLTRVSACELS